MLGWCIFPASALGLEGVPSQLEEMIPFNRCSGVRVSSLRVLSNLALFLLPMGIKASILFAFIPLLVEFSTTS